MRVFAVIFIVWISASLLCGCNRKTESPYGVAIRITGSEKTIVNSQQFIASIDSVPLAVGQGMHLAQVQDVCVTDSFIYILDQRGSIFMFNSQSGLLEKTANYTGHSMSEYIEPKSIISDGKDVFVLDFQGLGVLFFDERLNFKNKVSIKFPALDFSKTSNGFVFYNMNPTENLGRFVFTDMKGEVTHSFFTPKTELNNMFSDRIFSEDDYGNIYFSEALSDTIFKWDNKEIKIEYLLDSEQTQPLQSRSTNAIRSFITSKFVVTLYMINKFVLSNVFNKDTGNSVSGMVDTGIHYPFFPISSYKDTLIGVYELPIDDERKDGAEYMMIRYNLIK